jgi:nitroreductase
MRPFSMETAGMLNAILKRTSIRDFKKNRMIPETVLNKIQLAGIRAPSAGNIQPRTIITVRDDNVKERLYSLCEEQAFMKDAPVWFVICADLHRHLKAARLSGVDYDYTGILPFTFAVLDAALLTENIVIAAEAMGLGSVLIGSVIEHPQEVKEILKLPKHTLALCILCIGYPRVKPATRPKWKPEIIVQDDCYKEIELENVEEYWKEFIRNDLKRSGQEFSDETVESICHETSYGRSYANHYTEEFIRKTNRRLMEFLERQGLVSP